LANETLWNCLSRGPAARIVVSVGKRDRARDQLSKETVNNYRVGFVGVHDGRDAAFVFVDFWGNENELFPSRISLSRQQSREVISGEAGGLVGLRLGSAFAILRASGLD